MFICLVNQIFTVLIGLPICFEKFHNFQRKEPLLKSFLSYVEARNFLRRARLRQVGMLVQQRDHTAASGGGQAVFFIYYTVDSSASQEI